VHDSISISIDEIFHEWSYPETPGGSVTIVQDGKIIFMKGFGSADLEMSVPVGPSTKFYLASISKQFTGYCIANLIVAEKLSLDDDIREYIPEMQSFQDPVRIRDLVFQKSGLRDLYGLLPLTGFHLNDHLSNSEVLNMLYKQEGLNFPTGDKWQYSNSNYFLLGEIVKRVTGISLAEWAEKNVFTPLGMKNTYFVDSIGLIVPDRAKSYHQDRDGSFSNDPFLDVTVGHTGLYSTAEDMSKWLIHLHHMIKNGDPVLEIMLQTDTLNNGDEMNSYSFGLFKSSNNAIQYWHRGSLFGYKSIISYYPEQDFGLVILGNVQSFNRIRYAREITRLFYPDLVARRTEQAIHSPVPDSFVNTGIHIDPKILKKYEGNYVVDPMTVYVVCVRNDLIFLYEVGDSDTTRLIAIAPDQFRNDENSLLVSFFEDNEGLVDSMCYQTATLKATCTKANILSSPQEDEIVGNYYNGELEIYVTIEKNEDYLVAGNPRLGKFELYSTFENEFRCNHDFFSYISFYRGVSEHIEGFLLEGFSVSNIKFVKRE